jgi:uncharacterized caspase-like protein
MPASLCLNSKGVVTLASSLSDQVSWTRSPSELSLFTHFLVQGLDGVQEALDDGLLTVQSLFEYVSVMVQRVAKSHHTAQQPSMSVDTSGLFVLADFRGSK